MLALNRWTNSFRKIRTVSPNYLMNVMSSIYTMKATVGLMQCFNAITVDCNAVFPKRYIYRIVGLVHIYYIHKTHKEMKVLSLTEL